MATTETRKFAIALCGFSDSEQKALARAFMLSEARPRHYVQWAGGKTRPDICMVNEDLPAGTHTWSEIRQHGGADVPVVRIGMTAQASGLFAGVATVFFKRPLLANRILKTLDDLVTDVYRFAPELAIRDDMPAPMVGDTVQTESGKATSSAKRILVVDDSESVRKMMEVRLVKGGYAVDFATTGEDALTKAREGSYDLIFLDVMLPGIDGFDVSRLLKRNIRVKAPVVMLTGKTSRIDKLRGTLASADAYLTKPLSIDHLNETLQRYLS